MWSFYKTLLRNPRAVGAIKPSSPRLARTLTTFIPPDSNGLILELGAGTGVITQAMLNSGISSDRIIAIENSPYLIKTLNNRFPTITVMNKNAYELMAIVGDLSHRIDVVISGLPLFSLPHSTRIKFMQEIQTFLKPNTYYIQYGYRKSLFDAHPSFQKIASKKIWCNIPAAYINAYTTGI